MSALPKTSPECLHASLPKGATPAQGGAAWRNGIMTVANIGEYLQGKEKLKLHNLVGFAGDVLSVGNELATIAGKQATKLPETLEHMAGLQKIVSPASMKVIARFGVISVVAGTVNELNELDIEENPDMFIAVSLKNAVYIALLFSPAWVALGTIAVLELMWYFISDRIYNSKLELYLQDSLLFNSVVERGGQGRYHRKKSKSCHAQIMVESLRASEPAAAFTLDGKAVDPDEGVLSADAIRRFVADNYDAHTHTIERAVSNEQAALKQVLYGMKAEIADAKVLKHDLPMDKVYYRTHLAVDAKVLEDTKHLIGVFEGHYTEIDPKTLKLNEGKKLVDMAEGIVFRHLDGLKALEGKERGLIIVNDDIVLKYTAQYHTRSDTSYWGGSGQTLFTLTELKSGGLNAEDYEQVNKLLEKEGN